MSKLTLIESLAAKPQGFKQFPNWLICKIANSRNKVRMLTAAYIFMFMLDRVELSRQNGLIDNGTGRNFIYFPYGEVKKLLGCGTTTAWKIYKTLREEKLIETKQLGLCRPMMIFINTPDDRYSSQAENTADGTAMPNVPNAEEVLKNKYQAICGDTFSDSEIVGIMHIIADKTSGADINVCCEFLSKEYKTFKEQLKRKKVRDKYAYFKQMLKKAKSIYKHQDKPPKEKPSFDLDKIMEYTKNASLLDMF